MKKFIRTTLAMSLMLSASAAFAQELLIEGFEDTADPGGWQQVSPSPQTHNCTNTNTVPLTPAYVTTNVTEGVNAGQFTFAWTLPGVAAASNPYVSGGPLTFWSCRVNIAAPTALANNLIPNATGIIRADLFNDSTTDTFQVALHVIDNNGSGALERGPFVSIPPNSGITYEWNLGAGPVFPAMIGISGDGVLNGTSSRLRGFHVYTETAPSGTSLLTVDNIRVEAQSDLTPPDPPRLLSAVQGTNPGEVNLTWAANTEVDLAGYRVYVSTDANFGTPTVNRLAVGSTPAAQIANPAATSTTLTGLPTGENLYFTLTAYDNATPAQNESLPQIALTANLAADGSAPMDLLVLDYDRYNPSQANFTVNGYFHGAVYWAQSLADLNRTFGSARPAAVESGAVPLSTASSIVYWSTGRDGELVVDETITPASQTLITSHIGGGGNILVAGSAIGTDLSTNGDAGDTAFYAGTLKASLVAASSAQGGIDGDPAFFPTAGSFATSADTFNVAAGTNTVNNVIAPVGSAVGTLQYTGVTPGNAVVLDSGSLVYFGFAFETVRQSTTSTAPVAARESRTALLNDVIQYLDAPPVLDAESFYLYE